MKKTFISLIIATFLFIQPVSAETSKPRVLLETSHGEITLLLYPDKAPKTVDNFIRYVRNGFYDNTIFHRVIKGFMIQGGGLTPDMQKKFTLKPIPNEANNGLRNKRGTIAMARTTDPHSATSQFFINSKENAFLDHQSKTPRGWGYCVFGEVVEGMTVVDTIEGVRTGVLAGRRDVPIKPVVIRKAIVLPGSI